METKWNKKIYLNYGVQSSDIFLMTSHRPLIVLHPIVPKFRDLTHVARLYRHVIVILDFCFIAIMIVAIAALLWLLRVIANHQLALVDLWPLIVSLLSVIVEVIVERWIVMMLRLVVISWVGCLCCRLLICATQNLLIRLRFEMIQHGRWLFDFWEDRHLSGRQDLRLNNIFWVRQGWKILVIMRWMVVGVVAVALRLPGVIMFILLLIDERVRWLLTRHNILLLFPLLHAVRSHWFPIPVGLHQIRLAIQRRCRLTLVMSIDGARVGLRRVRPSLTRSLAQVEEKHKSHKKR